MNHDQEVQLLQNLSDVQQRIESLSAKSMTKPKLLAVSKKQSIDTMRVIYAAGMRVFAESFVQEAIDKIPALPEDITWHYIGRLQSNKLKKIAQYFHWLHTLTSIQYAEKLQSYCAKFNKTIQVLIQINVDMEVQKSGIMLNDREAIEHLVCYIVQHCPNLKLHGLMCMLKDTGEYDKELASFHKLAQCKDNINQKFKLNLQELSMGMSGDMPAAIAAGSTMLRIGSTIFGAR
ncbi:YggS family pyridoxal phosphate-dependent enzyme [Cysteiniphilum halobium]|uniref:YggS family pyridoxal phosphate-dependent enzyme n=1 Tax=Cysteiniphilum halobium TaxID=2219059 RepID=UPI000E65061A|nr:YggS family pyridoxal phosphate-dependent enzyme [Cysteiniphilum halobium]